MINRSSRTVAVEERRREEQWLAAMRDATEVATGRYTQMAALLHLDARATRAFLNAAVEAARQYHTACMYANYERRSGHPYPFESHSHDEDVAHLAWSNELEQLRLCLEPRG